MHPDNVAVGTLEFGINVDEALHPILARRNIGEADDGRTEIGRIDDRALPRAEFLNIAAEERNANAADFEARFALVVARDHHVHAARDRSGVDCGGVGDFKTSIGGEGGRDADRGGEEQLNHPAILLARVGQAILPAAGFQAGTHG